MSPKKTEEKKTELPEEDPKANEKTLKAQPADRKKRRGEKVVMPVFVEMVFSLSDLLLILITIAVAAVSFFSGANFYTIVIRTGTALLTTGILLRIITAQVAQSAVPSTFEEEKSAESLAEQDSIFGSSDSFGQDVKA